MHLAMNLALCAILGSCLSNERTFSDQVTVDPVEAEAKGVSEHVLGQGLHTLVGGAAVEWFSCLQGGDKPTFVVLSPADQSFSKGDVCQGPAAAELLEHGFNVLALNRPGQGASTGREAFGDDRTLKSLEDALGQQAKEGRNLVGLWAYGEASVLAFRLAKRLPFQILVIGDGLYDWELTLKESQDSAFVQRLKEAQGTADGRFAEVRSIAWDFGGLPRRIYLYHSNQNQQVLASQATAFKQALAASEYKVDLLLFDLPPPGTPFNPAYHRGLLTRILSKIQTEAAGN